MGEGPTPPRWAWWMIRKMLPSDEVRAVSDELSELFEHWRREHGRAEAARRYRRQVRQYPARLVTARLAAAAAALTELGSLRNTVHATRALARVPALSSAVILTIGVGIGGCTAIFAVVDALFLRPLPYTDADELVWIFTDSPPNRWPFSVVDYQALVEQQTSFEATAAYTSSLVTVTTPEVADRVRVARVSPGYFELLGIDLLAGRGPTDDDAVPGAPPTVVVTAGFASRYLGAAQSPAGLVGETVRLDGADHRVVGVVADRHGPLGQSAGGFATLQLEPPTRKGPFFLSVFGRLSVEPDVAAAELRAMNERLFHLWAESYQDEGSSWGMTSLQTMLTGDTDRLVLALTGSVGLLLLMGTTNAANLLLARVGGRRRELAVRVALGASRAKVVGHLLVECSVLALGGMGVGILIAWGAIDVMPSVASDYIPRLEEVSLSGVAVGFAVVLATASGLLFGLIAALGPDTGDLAGTLRSGGHAAPLGVRQQRAQRVLVIGQLAVAVPLLAGAALLGSSFVRLAAVDPGFESDGLISVRVPLARGSYPDGPSRGAFWDEVEARLTVIPGVRAVGVGSGRPPTVAGGVNNFDLEDRPTPPGATEPAVPWLSVDNGYFETLGIPLVDGRLFEPTDLDASAPVVVVDDAWARRFFPGEEAVGRRMVSGGCSSCPLTTVIGVVGTVPYLGLRRTDEGAVYGHSARTGLGAPVLHVRAEGDGQQVVSAIRAEIRALDPTIPLTDFSTGDDLLRDSLTQPRHLSALLASFSTVATLLAVIGLYGIIAYWVQQRRADIAIRLALGGAPRDVLAMVVRQGMTLAVVGVAVGAAVAVLFTRVLGDLLYEVEPADPVTLVGVAAILIAVSLIACGLPGRSAVRVDPVGALKAGQ